MISVEMAGAVRVEAEGLGGRPVGMVVLTWAVGPVTRRGGGPNPGGGFGSGWGGGA